MSSWTFYGRVSPERVPLTFPFFKGQIVVEGLSLSLDIETFIHNSQLISNATLVKGAADIETIRNVVLDQAKSLVDLAGYRHGCSFDVEIISAVDRNSNGMVVFGINIAGVSGRRGPQAGQIPGELLSAFVGDIAAKLALADFRRAMQDAVGTGFYCFRAIEAIMQTFKNNTTKKDSAAWNTMRGQLYIDRSAIDKVQSHSRLSRHGLGSSITDDDRSKVLRITDIIIDRYLIFITEGRTPFSTDRFQLLV